MRKKLLIVVGTVSLGLGLVGIVLPLLPTTPFLLLAAACYMRGSKRWYNWLMNHRYLGPYIRDYREGKGIPLTTKIGAILLLWATISYSALFVVPPWLWLRVLLFGIAIGVTVHLVKLPTRRQPETEQSAPEAELPAAER